MNDAQRIRELECQVEQLTQIIGEGYKMAQLGRLAAGVVHEINTPIGSLFSNSDVIAKSLDYVLAEMKSGNPLPPKVLKTLEVIASLNQVDRIACERIASVIRSLKTYSRVDDSEARKVDLHPIIEDSIKLIWTDCKRRIQFVKEFGPLPEVECFPHLLSQVLVNLLANASQAIEGEGVITVRTAVDGDMAHIAVSDSGRGIRPEDQARIFSPGFSTKPIGVGTGLGLSIARKIVEETHRGRISFTSAPGAGTTFDVRVPLVRRKEGT